MTLTSLESAFINITHNAKILKVVDAAGDNLLGYLVVPMENEILVKNALSRRGLVGYEVTDIEFCKSVQDLPDWYGEDY